MWVENGETLQLSQKGKTITCTMDNSVLLVVSRLSSYSNSICFTSRRKDQSNYSRKLVPLLDLVTTWSDKHACGKPVLTDHEKQATGICEPADETNEEDPTQGTPVWLQPFTVYLEDLEMWQHIPLNKWTQIRKVRLQKWRHKNGSIVFMLTSAKTKRDLFCDQKNGWPDNSRAKKKTKDVNLGTITDTLT